jgi:cobalt/nickel transport system permease protein
MKPNQWLEMGRMDELGRMDTPAHRLDARTKVVATTFFVVAVMSFPRYEIAALTPFFFYPLALMRFGNIPPGLILGKLLVALPFALMIGLFNPLLDRQPVTLGSGVEIAGGWLSLTSILLRFLLTAGTALILIACTGMNRLCAGLERLGMPRLFAVQLLFLYRYLFVVAAEGARMLRGLRLRSAGDAPALRIYGSLTGHLLLRSMARADRVYQAMTARGFDGTVRLLRRDRIRPVDLVFLLGWIAFFAAARIWNLAALLGDLFA